MSRSREFLGDRHLERVAGELLRHDDRVRGMPVELRVDGGVVHVSGEAASTAQLWCLRELLGRLAGVHAVWDRIRVAGRPPRMVDLGCGDTKQYAESIGVDTWRTPSVDVVADVTRPLPFADCSVDRIWAVHVLEHLLDYLPLVEECHRVLRPYGVLHVLSPNWRHINAIADPTHLRLLAPQTFKYFCRPRSGLSHWYPLMVSTDGNTVFADLTPSKGGHPPADDEQLARFFD